jgi:hypothetical protein
MQRPWPPPLREKHTTATLHHSPSPFDNAAAPAAATAGAAVAIGTSENKGDANCERGSARASAGVTQIERRESEDGEQQQQQQLQQRALPPATFFCFIFLLSEYERQQPSRNISLP